LTIKQSCIYNPKLIAMPEKLRVFMTPQLEEQFNAAYDAMMRRWPVLREDLYIPTRFGQTHVVAGGRPGAMPLILLNPGGGSAAIWINNVKSLSQVYRTYAVDVIGEMNKSIPTRPIKNNAEFIEWVIDLFDGLKINKTNLVGNSNGGYFAMNVAINLPDRINKVVLISPASTFVQMWAWWFHLLIPAHMIAPLIRSESMVHRAYSWLWNGFPLDEDYARLRSIGTIAGYPRYRPTRNKISPRVFSNEDLGHVRNPVLLLIGDGEVIYKPEKAFKRAKQLVQGLQYTLIPNANHCAQFTAPEAVNSKVLEFLAAP
jgi:pimeloyl-ACP methyl ester carboxylesterase